MHQPGEGLPGDCDERGAGLFKVRRESLPTMHNGEQLDAVVLRAIEDAIRVDDELAHPELIGFGRGPAP